MRVALKQEMIFYSKYINKLRMTCFFLFAVVSPFISAVTLLFNTDNYELFWYGYLTELVKARPLPFIEKILI